MPNQIILDTNVGSVVKVGSECYYLHHSTTDAPTHSADSVWADCNSCLSSSSSNSSSSSSSSSGVPPAPTMNLTVTGASGTINWCGQTWNLPGDSGLTKGASPTTYQKTINSSYIATTTNYGKPFQQWTALHRWLYNNSLKIERIGFSWIFYAGYASTYRLAPSNGTWRPSSRVYLNPGVGAASFGWTWGSGGTNYANFAAAVAGRPAVATFNGSVYNLNGGTFTGLVLGTVGQPNALASGYSIHSGMFGSYTKSGITYAWAQGTGW